MKGVPLAGEARRRERGIALLVVLWACTLLAILLGGFATLVRTESIQTRYLSGRVQLRYLAEAGAMRALAECVSKSGGRWIGDARPYTLRFEGHDIDIRVQDELGKVDLNTAEPQLLQRLFLAAGVDEAAAAKLAANIQEARDARAKFFREEGARRYAEAGLEAGPRYREFDMPEQLQTVLGVTPALYRKLAPAITVWSRRPQPVAALAPPLVLASLPDMDMARAQRYVAQRAMLSSRSPPPVLPNGQLPGGWRGGQVKTIVASATDGQGTTARVLVTFKLTVLRGGLGYSVLRWQEDGAG
ncbi:type II secretion system protein GspK [Dyella sp. BiH032]|uniref:general secretion pathway protein GspK n=1 Tax=Dyella sp. BiH032 TaxID=3075430 RepID=UPI002892B688|nr:type II secretion system protein GspK [Dyella sp. BiH032]WNL44450.1 type II secretion system protein GspK [Dyella sp. BiH032]